MFVTIHQAPTEVVQGQFTHEYLRTRILELLGVPSDIAVVSIWVEKDGRRIDIQNHVGELCFSVSWSPVDRSIETKPLLGSGKGRL